ncbi:ammonia channel protein [Lampropedia cohaerens]|uniref:Ammonium transporter n=1 Tax=Lampropedia cohaerens TaxID=1610491 RepID=A0A0U1PYB1_9BURK|nr:ammonium transporter [Lampropedia cohaerens]KKW67504.1 ammonia channel protein [Lampropedia cohaerens]
MNKRLATALGLGALAATPLALAQEAAPVVAEIVSAVAEAEPAIDTGDTAWMLTSTVLVILMSIPGLALFYGGLARSKNMVSVLLQVLAVFSLITLLWAVYGFSLAFGGEGKVYGSFDYVFLKGITPDTISSALSTIPEFVFVSFQAAFAAITVALVVGSLAERVKFGAVMVFSIIWFTFSYLPMAHMVWGGGLLAEDGALDFAGGTVIHINAGVAGLVGAYVLGKRAGYGKEALAPHNLAFTMIGACLLWVGWFGFNAGSAGAANGVAGLAFINTIVATSAGVLAWLIVESLAKGKPSLLGGASGAVAGLVGVTPAAGFVGPVGAILIGALSGAVCVWGVSGLKRMLNVDDSFDVFGIHGVAGIIGALLTGVFVFPSLGGVGVDDVTMAGQVWIQLKSVIVTVILSSVVAFIAFMVAKATVGLRVSAEAEREGLDLTSHGERAYNS